MFRFVALFALVAVAFAEPEADPQYLVNPRFYHHLGVPVVKPVVPVVKYVAPVVKPVVPVMKFVDPHHTEGMTADGVPEKTDSVKIAEKQHEIAQIYEKSKKAFLPYVVPSAYAGYAQYPYAQYPYVHSVVPTVGHVIAKREAEGEADPYLIYNTHAGVTGYAHTVAGYPYTTAVAGYPYTSAVAGYPYTTGVSGYPYTTAVTGHHYPVVHTIAKREADSDAQYFYGGYTPYNRAYSYGNYGVHPYTYGYRHAYNRWG